VIAKAQPLSNVPSLVSVRLTTGGMSSLVKSTLDACSVPEGFVRVVRFVRAGRVAGGKEEKRREGGNVRYSAETVGFVGVMLRVGESRFGQGARGWNEDWRGIRSVVSWCPG
jgi:hypothetical protein